MADAKDTVQQSENAVGGGKKRACVAHCKRFWWAHLIAFICIVVLVVCLVIFVGIPKIAQGKIDDAKLTIDSIIISKPESESYNMAVNSTITTDGSVHAEIDGFTGVMYLEDLEAHEPFASIDFPETTSAKLTTVNVSQTVEVTNMEAFTTFNTWLLANESLKLTIEGDTNVHLKGISRGFGVTFKKTVDLKGLNGFHGLEVTSANLDLVKTENNFNGTVDIPNASILTIEIGNTTFVNMYEGEDIGTVYIDDLILYPGINNRTMYADIEQRPVLEAVTTEPHCTDGVVPFELKGKDVVNNENKLAYFADALASLSTNVDIGLKDAFDRAGLEIGCGSSDDEDDESEE